MNFLIIAGIIVAIFSLLAYVRPGRAGIAILALIAGRELAELWAAQLATYSSHAADKLDVPLWPGVFYVALVLVPAVLLLLLRKGTTSRVPRLLSALAVGMLATTLVTPVLESVFVIDPASRPLYTAITQYGSLITTVAVIIAFTDLLFTRSSKSHGHTSHD